MPVPEILAAIGIIVSIYAIYTANKAKSETKQTALEKENLQLKLSEFIESIKRVNKRLDEVLEGQASTTHELNGANGFHTRIAVLEERCKEL